MIKIEFLSIIVLFMDLLTFKSYSCPNSSIYLGNGFAIPRMKGNPTILYLVYALYNCKPMIYLMYIRYKREDTVIRSKYLVYVDYPHKGKYLVYGHNSGKFKLTHPSLVNNNLQYSIGTNAAYSWDFYTINYNNITYSIKFSPYPNNSGARFDLYGNFLYFEYEQAYLKRIKESIHNFKHYMPKSFHHYEFIFYYVKNEYIIIV